MLIRSSNRAALLATASFVFALGAAVGPLERQAFAQQQGDTPSTTQDKKEKDKPEAKDASQTTTSEEDEQKKAEEAKKAEEEPAEEKKPLDTTVEAAKAIYLSGDIGFTRSDLGLISDKTGFDRTGANGLLYGLSAGVRLKDLRLGARWRVYDTTEFSLWTVALSAGYGLPIRPISPVFSAHIGYVFDQSTQEGLIRKSLPAGSVLPPDVDVKGLLLGVDVNASYWVTKSVRLGAFIGADLMFLSRERVGLPYSIFGVPPEVASNPLYTDSGSGIGLNLNAGIRGAFDIGFQ